MSAVSEAIKAAIDNNRNIVVTGEEGVGKVKKTIEALQDRDNIYYIGNPFDFRGNLRPEGYEKYILDVRSLKKDLRIIPTETDMGPALLPENGPVLIIDEIYGRTAAQHEKITSLLTSGRSRAVLITGCLKNVGRMVEFLDLGIMLIGDDDYLTVERDFLIKIGSILKPESH